MRFRRLRETAFFVFLWFGDNFTQHTGAEVYLFEGDTHDFFAFDEPQKGAFFASMKQKSAHKPFI
jgi:hypothetical protein